MRRRSLPPAARSRRLRPCRTSACAACRCCCPTAWRPAPSPGAFP